MSPPTGGIGSIRRVKLRLAVGLALAMIVTAVLTGAVATAAAISIELSDGDTCETGGVANVGTTATPENVTSLAGNVTKCIAGGGDVDVPAGGPPLGNN